MEETQTKEIKQIGGVMFRCEECKKIMTEKEATHPRANLKYLCDACDKILLFILANLNF